MKINKKICLKCERKISLTNFDRHFRSCNRIVRKVLSINNNWLDESGKYKCPFCDKLYSKFGIATHIWKNHGEGKNHNPNIGLNNKIRISWNKGLTKKMDPRVAKNGRILSENIKSGKTKIKPRKHTEISKQKLSESMKKAHKEGRAWNIGMSRWNNKPSYPEKFFMKVIENEFDDKNYIREYSVGIYSIDFAWVEKKKAIEIDGEQHQRFKEYQERDKRKDLILEENGWKVLRIPWKDFYSDTKKIIIKLKNFIR